MPNTQPSVLIVDDEKGLRFGTKRLLEIEGFDVETAENGTLGIKAAKNRDFDVAVIDLKMPDIDGLEVLKKVKEMRPNTVCFIATAFASYDTAIEATRLGAYTYIPKPFTPEELLHQLNKGLEQRNLLIEAEELRTEREANLMELADEKSRLSTVLNSISGGVLVINLNGKLVYFNNASLINLDLKKLEYGEFFLDKLPKEIVNLVMKYLSADKYTDITESIEIEIKPNNELYIQALCSHVPSRDDRFAGVVLVTRNITELKQIELVKNQFVSMVAHELKTPLAAVQGFLQILEDPSMEIPKEKEKDFISRSVIRIKGLLSLVNDLLDISRMEVKSKRREIEELDVKEILDSTIQFLEIDLRQKGVNVESKIPDVLPSIKADNNEITRLFTNILSNAIKYNKDNGNIYIDVLPSDNYITFEIADTGIGMKPEDVDRLFSEFFRAKNKHTRNISGTGLGLTIVKKIVESYHGKISVESTYGEGTKFIVQLPINK